MRALTIIAALALGVAVAGAETWSLDRCIEYAVDHNIDVRSSRLSAYEGELSVTEAKDRFLPQVNGYASQNFNLGRALTADNTYANRNTSSFAAGASLNLPLFQGLRAVRNLQYSRTALKALLERTEAAKDDVTLNVISQYLQALYASEMLQVARIRLDISRAELVRRQALLDAGRIPELDIYEAKAQVSSDELAVTTAVNDSILARLDLAQLLNLDSAEGFEIEPLADDTPLPASPDDVFANAMESNHNMRAARFELEAAERNVSVAKSGYIPTLSFNAGIGTNYYKTSGFNNESFGPQMRHNFAQSFGFSLSVPVFDAFGTRNSVRRAKAQSESMRLQLDDRRNRLYKAIMQAYTQATGAIARQESAESAVESARAAFEAMQVKYDNGRANATEFEKSKSTYTSALAEAVQAKYERMLRARILAFYNKSPY